MATQLHILYRKVRKSLVGTRQERFTAIFMAPLRLVLKLYFNPLSQVCELLDHKNMFN